MHKLFKVFVNYLKKLHIYNICNEKYEAHSLTLENDMFHLFFCNYEVEILCLLNFKVFFVVCFGLT